MRDLGEIPMHEMTLRWGRLKSAFSANISLWYPSEKFSESDGTIAYEIPVSSPIGLGLSSIIIIIIKPRLTGHMSVTKEDESQARLCPTDREGQDRCFRMYREASGRWLSLLRHVDHLI